MCLLEYKNRHRLENNSISLQKDDKFKIGITIFVKVIVKVATLSSLCGNHAIHIYIFNKKGRYYLALHIDNVKMSMQI